MVARVTKLCIMLAIDMLHYATFTAICISWWLICWFKGVPITPSAQMVHNRLHWAAHRVPLIMLGYHMAS